MTRSRPAKDDESRLDAQVVADGLLQAALTAAAEGKPGGKEIYAHLRGLWSHLRSLDIPFKAHWGKINFIDPAFAAEQYDLERFRRLASPVFVNEYLTERIGALE